MAERPQDPTTKTGALLRVVRGAGDLVRAEGPVDGAGGECVVSRGAVRVGDRNEPWTVPVTDAVRALAAAGARCGVDFELAARVGVEWALVCDDLRVVGVDPAALDRPAAVERVTGELDAAAASYLRRLTAWGGGAAGARPGTAAAAGAGGAGAGGAGGAGAGAAGAAGAGTAVGAGAGGAGAGAALGELVTVGLPARLSARLLRADLGALLAAVELERALAWEVAALLTGRTLSEWAPLTALTLDR